MNWLWVIIGAIAGALLLQEIGGLLLGAILGTMASRLSRSRRSEQAFEKRLHELERKLAKLERVEPRPDELKPVEPAIVTQPAEPSLPPLIDDDALTVQALATPQAEIPRTSTQSAPTFSDPSWTRTPNPWMSLPAERQPAGQGGRGTAVFRCRVRPQNGGGLRHVPTRRALADSGAGGRGADRLRPQPRAPERPASLRFCRTRRRLCAVVPESVLRFFALWLHRRHPRVCRICAAGCELCAAGDAAGQPWRCGGWDCPVRFLRPRWRRAAAINTRSCSATFCCSIFSLWRSAVAPAGAA